MLFLLLGAMLSGSSRNSIARISGLVSLGSYRIQQLLQPLLMTTRLLLLLKHLRLCSIALLLTRYRMRLSVVVLDRARSLRASPLARWSSKTSGKPLASSRPAVTAKSLAVNKLLLVGRKLKRFFPTLGNFVAKV
jgi:hypothetical protein